MESSDSCMVSLGSIAPEARTKKTEMQNEYLIIGVYQESALEGNIIPVKFPDADTEPRW